MTCSTERQQDANAVQRAVSLLARRDHSRLELTTKLQARGFSFHEIEVAIAKVLDWGYLNEARFISSFVRARVNKGYGPMRVKADLLAKGVDQLQADHALSNKEHDWFALCHQLLIKKRLLIESEDATHKARAYRYLFNRGFTSEQIQFALGFKNER